MNNVNNSGGEILYGMHFYPGLAEYSIPNSKPHRIFLNEETLRKMDPTFAGKPIFVEHVDEVTQNLDELNGETDGWVVESFYNDADGKHWTKFIITSEKGKRAVKNGYRLSNAYQPRLNGKPGMWNGVTYDDEVIDGEYEHLAIVKNPRYAESVIMTPEEFKKYNNNLKQELIRISNSKEKEKKMATVKDKIFGMFYKKEKLENSLEIGETFVTLPKANKEFSLFQIVNEMDEFYETKIKNEALPDMNVKLHDGTSCKVIELVEKYKNACDKMEKMNKKNEKMSTTKGLEMDPEHLDVEGDLHNEEDEDEDDDMKKEKMKNKKKNEDYDEDEDDDMKKEKMKNKKKNSFQDRQNFDVLKNAHLRPVENQFEFDPILDATERGRALFGSGN